MSISNKQLADTIGYNAYQIASKLVELPQAKKLILKYKFKPQILNPLKQQYSKAEISPKVQKLLDHSIGLNFSDDGELSELMQFRTFLYGVFDLSILWLLLYMLDDFGDLPVELIKFLNLLITKLDMFQTASDSVYTRPLECGATAISFDTMLKHWGKDTNFMNTWHQNANDLFDVVGLRPIFKV